MNKTEYLKELSNKLKKMPREEANEAVQYYSEYFEDAGAENEQSVIERIGSPEQLSKQIISECAIKSLDVPKKTVKGGLDTVWIVILAICVAPFAFPAAAAMVSAIGALVVAVVAITGSIFIIGIALIFAGFISLYAAYWVIMTNVPVGILTIGLGLLLIGIGIVSTLGGIALARVMFLGIAALFKKVIKKEGKNNEEDK